MSLLNEFENVWQQCKAKADELRRDGVIFGQVYESLSHNRLEYRLYKEGKVTLLRKGEVESVRAQCERGQQLLEVKKRFRSSAQLIIKEMEKGL